MQAAYDGNIGHGQIVTGLRTGINDDSPRVQSLLQLCSVLSA